MSWGVHNWPQLVAHAATGETRGFLHLVEEGRHARCESFSNFHPVKDLLNGNKFSVVEAPHMICSGSSAHAVIELNKGGLVHHFAQAECIYLRIIQRAFQNRLNAFIVCLLSKYQFERLFSAVKALSCLSIALWTWETNRHHLKTNRAISKENCALYHFERRIVCRFSHLCYMEIISYLLN